MSNKKGFVERDADTQFRILWLKRNATRVSRMRLMDVAKEMKKAGLYSQSTYLGDIVTTLKTKYKLEEPDACN